VTLDCANAAPAPPVISRAQPKRPAMRKLILLSFRSGNFLFSQNEGYTATDRIDNTKSPQDALLHTKTQLLICPRNQ
jgi:hypothetical protein